MKNVEMKLSIPVMKPSRNVGNQVQVLFSRGLKKLGRIECPHLTGIE